MAVSEELAENLSALDAKTVDEGTVVELLRRRYTRDEVYTAIGDILLLMNPFKPLPLYDLEVIQAYQYSKPGKQMSPHVYSKCKEFLRSMQHSSKSQCCVLTGDSASGKTESLKHILLYIINTTIPTQPMLKAKFLQVHFILEAFGNAVTPQNHNSSRFALYCEVFFSSEHKLSGGKVYHYMLEKSRVAHQEKGGKNFHVFHYLFYGMDANKLQEYWLSRDFPHRYLSYDPSVPAEDNASEEVNSTKYSKLLSYMESLGFSNEEIQNLVNCLASILHIGNIAFVASSPETNLAAIKDLQPVRCAGALLGVSADILGAALITGTAYRKGEKVSFRKTVESAAEGCDNLAKSLYSRLFSWIVLKINSCLKGNSQDFNRQRLGPSLGLLDVFGFERMEINCLEQLCINTANEQLEYFYNQRLFAWEQAELEAEGLHGIKIPYHDNKKTVELLFNPPNGLLPFLDEESRSPRATDVGYVRKCDSVHKKHPSYSTPKMDYPGFTIRHYRSPVTYVGLGFLNHNRDLVGASVLDCLRGSDNEFLSRLFFAKLSGTGSLAVQPERLLLPDTLMQNKTNKRRPTIRHKTAVVQHLASKEKGKGKTGFLTIATQLRTSIAELMEKVLSCDVHFIRCINPNRAQQPNEFKPDVVLSQVRSLAVVQTAHIRNLGYPVWLSFDAFIERFGIVVGLLPNAAIKDLKQTCQKMLRHLADPEGWIIGKTKVFLTYWCLERLYIIFDLKATNAVIIQKVFRGWQARRLFSRLKHLKTAQENAVRSFLDSIVKQSEVLSQHISNQVMEENARQKKRRSEETALQKQTQSPSFSSSHQTGFDINKDTPDGFPSLSPRYKSPQKRTSDLSVSSIADAFSQDTPSRSGPPQSRASDLSMISITSISSAFSMESDEFDTAAPHVWCKITCFEREHQRAEFSVDRPSIIIDGSSNSFDVTRIGLGALPPSSDSKVTKVRGCVGKGVQIVNDDEGSVWASRGSKNAIFVKGHFLSNEVVALKGALEKDVAMKVFDWESFADSVRYHCLHSKNFDHNIEKLVLSSASIFFSFVKDGKDDVNTPCWVQLDVLEALQQGQAACKYARDKRKQEKQQAINSLPPILRPKTKTSRELAGVARFQQKVRPRRYINTFRFSRKKWARKEVALNPFLFGNTEISQIQRQTPVNSPPRKSTSEPEKALDDASPVPNSLSGVYGNNADVTDGGPGQSPDLNGNFEESDLEISSSRNGFHYQNRVTSSSIVEKPVKKVWARQKFADDSKSRKGKKRS